MCIPPKPSAPGNAWQVTLECPTLNCRSTNVQHVTNSRPTRKVNDQSTAVVYCPNCSTEWVLTINLTTTRKIPYDRDQPTQAARKAAA